MMEKLFEESAKDEITIRNLIEKSTPWYRQAYSDRVSWLMACISELAYLEFESLSKKNLSLLSCEIIKTFDKGGTQAVLLDNEQYLILAFRGTEAHCLRDIKSDIKAFIKPCETGGKIHTGFQEAYERVAPNIENILADNKFKSKPLLITGHSLGGALATIAAKKITHTGGNAACYTFGAPRVGDKEWVSNMRTPLYRVVNAYDCVTMLPLGEIIILIGRLVGIIPRIGKPMRNFLLSKFHGYRHGGNMRYLTDCETNRYADVKLLYSVSLFFRLKCLKSLWLSSSLKRFLVDHSISIYRKKLMIIAKQRNE